MAGNSGWQRDAVPSEVSPVCEQVKMQSEINRPISKVLAVRKQLSLEAKKLWMLLRGALIVFKPDICPNGFMDLLQKVWRPEDKGEGLKENNHCDTRSMRLLFTKTETNDYTVGRKATWKSAFKLCLCLSHDGRQDSHICNRESFPECQKT